ncbi:hypothetical protein CEUSTIGMA_g7936.t1 [Chlamydomonas eustigma]|uniref:Peptidase M20 dimerisation domain-containing protein n=1 Tax=Chlamydomonas eustigma TaxID=1157962 RepID=A0A250XBP3_9CHLO|nr:hypothetical protein CEUSTIGMA_g7936.t1 [Chlamydomonas eustigma]|eukprot:GAX80498.1 hypothetical protein CEUSTIGMA_g7936.t1 [Chlamydomonas eustigma]
MLAFIAILLTADHVCGADWLTSGLTLQPWLVKTRRDLHKIPELGFAEHKTSQYLQDVLTSLNITYSTGHATTGIVATIGSGLPMILLRADIDALPIQEPEGFEARSQHSGVMHACGHDAHMAMLLGAARLLQEEHKRASLRGTVKLVFQPYEEGGAGADVILNTGVLDGVEAAFGIHVWPALPSGVLATRAGAIMAGALSFEITVKGRGGHAAMPHQNIDPIVAAAGMISSMQTLVSRETSPLGSAVLSVTMMRAGDAFNVIPDTAMFAGTIRSLDHAALLHNQRRVEEMAVAFAAGYGCNASVNWRLDEQPLYPPTVNDPPTAAFTTRVAKKLLGEGHVVETEPSMGGEDFAFFCLKMPCTYAFLGIRNEDAGSVHALHSPRFTLDEGELFKGAAMHTVWALEYLASRGIENVKRDEL